MLGPQHRRKRHKNSHKGCGNCKLRRVKCDETKPDCLKCQRNGLLCNYKGDGPLLESRHESTGMYSTFRIEMPSQNEAVRSNINDAISTFSPRILPWAEFFKLKYEDLECLERFLNRTLAASGPRNIDALFQRESFRLMTTNQYLLHIAMTVTLMHDRYLTLQIYQKPTELESYHWGKGLKLFNKELSENSQNHSLPAMWYTAGLLSWVSLFSVETDNPEQAWPLKIPEPSDLNWLEMQKGIRVLYPYVKAENNEDLFKGLRKEACEYFFGSALSATGTKEILAPLVALCDLDESSNSNNNPYYNAAFILSYLLPVTEFTCTLRFLAFANSVQPQFETLLRLKDPRALVLLAIWYEIGESRRWWMCVRATVERKAIGIYLNRYHSDDPWIQPFLTPPRYADGKLVSQAACGWPAELEVFLKPDLKRLTFINELDEITR